MAFEKADLFSCCDTTCSAVFSFRYFITHKGTGLLGTFFKQCWWASRTHCILVSSGKSIVCFQVGSGPGGGAAATWTAMMTRTRAESAEKRKFMVVSWDESDQHYYCQVKPRAGKLKWTVVATSNVCRHHKERTFLRRRRNRDDGDMEIGLIIDNHDFDGRHTRCLDIGVVFLCLMNDQMRSEIRFITKWHWMTFRKESHPLFIATI